MGGEEASAREAGTDEIDGYEEELERVECEMGTMILLFTVCDEGVEIGGCNPCEPSGE